MSRAIQADDLNFFAVLAGAGSLSAAARELGISTPAVSKHLALLESRLGLTLINRSTRRMNMTPEGELLHYVGDRAVAGVARGSLDGTERLVAGQCHAGLWSYPRGATHFKFCAGSSAGRYSFATVCRSAGSDR